MVNYLQVAIYPCLIHHSINIYLSHVDLSISIGHILVISTHVFAVVCVILYDLTLLSIIFGDVQTFMFVNCNV